MKRCFDIFFTILVLPLVLPVAGIVAWLVFLKMGRPIFFTQERAGLNGKPFFLLKFRTMRLGEGTDAERLTSFGAFLRRTSLDELPEIVNILRGEMSWVGPRPLPIRYLPRYSPEQRHRHDVLPGLTGWAQVNGRNALSWDEKFKFDLEYVSRHSLAFDVRILFRTVAQVLSARDVAHAGEATMGEFNPPTAL